jgi:DNA-binding response OmpR family regulator
MRKKTMIHLVEDDINIGKNLVLNLELDGKRVIWSQTILEAKQNISNTKFSIMIFDINLPDGNGFDLCKEVRESDITTPILFLTAQGDEDSLVTGFEVGGNDYIRKPFSFVELRARIKAWHRNLTQLDLSNDKKDLIIDEGNRTVSVYEQVVKLNRREYDTLIFLLRRLDSIVTREELIGALSLDLDVIDRTVDSHVSRLRGKLKKSGLDTYLIQSEYGIGYRMIHNDSK